MAVAGKDGAWVSTQPVVRFNCTKCGTFLVKPANEREAEETARWHIINVHKGVA